MSQTIRKSMASAATIAAIATASVGLTAAGAGAAVGTSASAAVAATPTLTATITKKGLKFSGPTTFRAGRVAISVKAVGGEGGIQVVSLKKGYTFADLKTDLGTYGASQGENGGSAAGLKALNHAVDHANIYGGLDADPGQTVTGSVVLATPGTYYFYSSAGLPAQPTKLVVTGPEVVRASPGASATVTATSAKRFAGATTLPATGTITFKNTSTNSPHFLSLQHVKKGTTRAQIMASLMNQSNAEPSFALQGDVNTDILGEGHAMTMSYSLPKGEYVELCFFPDLKTGIPHALMGMFRIVTLK